MALYCLISPGGAPGVTTTALGLALTWPGKVLLAECDPAGRRVLPGFMAERLRQAPGPGLLGLAMAMEPDPHAAAASLAEYALPLGDGEAELLHGIRDPRHVQQLASLWRPLAEAFTAVEGDVIADLGRVGGPDTPVALLAAADAVVVVLRRTLAQVDAAVPRLEVLRGLVGEQVPVGLCVIEDGSYSIADVRRVLELPVFAELPYAMADARVLSDGAPPRLTFKTSLLMRAVDGLGKRMRKAVAERLVPDGEPSTSAPVTLGGGR
ncbi:hypothetical protein SAMN04489712_104129 [Thermomonospora echinospora]|uniref:MinD-like ATPase involved in chromosome partitioning or flagellar assembly n=1 Tax=Thermomonospora echinospora TaxID=1992 RepID=A0A1H5YRL4_9ACTN|nr:hypothetical protein [Thermomonospora echinospora]SEG26312.1 hypothetical protein SAMN04489712_104129 [Thermomonospora echinospora]